MTWLRRILPLLLVLGFALGTPAQVAQAVGMAHMAAMTHATMDDGMAGCEGCRASQIPGNGMAMAGCHGGICIVLPGLLPSPPVSLRGASATFTAAAPAVLDGRSLAPDHPPPKPAALA